MTAFFLVDTFLLFCIVFNPAHSREIGISYSPEIYSNYLALLILQWYSALVFLIVHTFSTHLITCMLQFKVNFKILVSVHNLPW